MLVVSFYKIRFLALKSADYLNLDVNQFNSSLLENVNVSLYQFLIIQGGNFSHTVWRPYPSFPLI